MSEIPFVAFGNDELDKMPPLKAGDAISCKCGSSHIVEDSKPPMLLFYQCGGSTFLAGVNGKNVMGKP